MGLSKNKIIELFSRHVSSGKVDTYRKYEMLLVPQKRGGCYLHDMNGKRYLNCHSNGGVFNLGHRNRDIIHVVTRAMKTYDMGNHHLMSGPRALCARDLAAAMPAGLNQVVYGVSGGEAIDLAIKLARGVTGRPGIISSRGAYHGHTGFALTAGDKKYKEKFKPLPSGFTQVPFNDITALETGISKKTAAVIMETIPATLGIVVPHRDYFKKVKKLCEEYGALLILDEVQTGFGRTGKLWGFQNFGVIPDIVVLGKGMSGGIYPITATVYNERYSDFFREDPFVHISTCGGSEIGCCAASEVLRKSARKEFLNHVLAMHRFFTGRFDELKHRYSGTGFSLRGVGLMMGLEFKDEITSMFMVKLLFDQGIYVVYSGNDPRVVQFLPPLIITEKEARHAVHGIEKALRELTGNTGRRK